MLKFYWGPGYDVDGIQAVNMKAVFAELIAMTLFVVIGCGTACANGAGTDSTKLVVAFAFGLAIMCLAYTIGKHSGGQINCAVTLSLVAGGKLPWYQGLANFIAQMFGSLFGAVLLCGIFPCEDDMTGSLGSNIIDEKYSVLNALFGEAFGTFLLCYVVYETAVNPNSGSGRNTCLAIGFAVFLAHVLLLPMDGCSINPTRSFGPAFVGALRGCENTTYKGLEHLPVMWAGPFIGAVAAAVVQKGFLPAEKKSKPVKAEDINCEILPRVPGGPSTRSMARQVIPDDTEDIKIQWGEEVKDPAPAAKGNCFPRICKVFSSA